MKFHWLLKFNDWRSEQELTSESAVIDLLNKIDYYGQKRSSS